MIWVNELEIKFIHNALKTIKTREMKLKERGNEKGREKKTNNVEKE